MKTIRVIPTLVTTLDVCIVQKDTIVVAEEKGGYGVTSVMNGHMRSAPVLKRKTVSSPVSFVSDHYAPNTWGKVDSKDPNFR